ncbi:hypothetical protein MARINOS108_20697 [Marinoscillum sp. 108]|nr:hypothetical protein MARINOS108_20697 [Marinoscillum sp. 108]
MQGGLPNAIANTLPEGGTISDIAGRHHHILVTSYHHPCHYDY